MRPSYPTCDMPVSVHAAVGKALRPLMDANGFSSTELIGYEHNWDDAGKYPVQLVSSLGNTKVNKRLITALFRWNKLAVSSME